MLSADPVSRAAWARAVRARRPPADLTEYLAGFEAFFDQYAPEVDHWRPRNAGYHERSPRSRASTSLAAPGCSSAGAGPASCWPRSSRRRASASTCPRPWSGSVRRHPHLHFHHDSAERLDLPGRTFDYIILSDSGLPLRHPRGVRAPRRGARIQRIIITGTAGLWQPVVHLLEPSVSRYRSRISTGRRRGRDQPPAARRIRDFSRVRGAHPPADPPRADRPVDQPFLPDARSSAGSCGHWVVARPRSPPAPCLPRSASLPVPQRARQHREAVRRLPAARRARS